MTGFVAIAAQELRITLRRGESVLLTFLIPLGLLLFFGATDLLDVDIDEFVPALFALSLVSASFVGLAVATGFERKYRVLKRFGATPVSRLTLIAAKTAAVAVVEVVQIALLWVVAALAFDWSPDVRWAGFAVAYVLGTAGPAGLAMLLAGRLRAEATLALANGLYFLFLGIGDIIVPLDRLPAAVAGVSQLLPVAPLVAAFQWATGVGAVTTTDWIVLVAWAVAAPLTAARLFTWEER
ncbi:MAG: ABC transporter permease [Acidimicrobiia bacterium]